jgi:hypothetical protein
MSFDNTNRGALFRNNRREADTDADFRGSINVGGTEYWLNGWSKTSKAGEKYLSLPVREKQVPKARPIPGRTDEDGIDF